MEKERVEEQNKLPVPLDSGILYTVVALYYVYASPFLLGLQLKDEANLLISQLLFFAVPPLFLALIRHYDIKKTFRLKAPKPLEALIMLVISPVMVISGLCAGVIALLGVKSIFGRVYLTGEVADYMSKGLLVSLLLVAVLPALCEEFLFRGMIQRGLEKLGVGWSIFLSGLLFGLFHFDFQRLAAQTLIGFIAAYAVYRTGSIVNGMILHFMNNGLLTLLTNLSLKGASGAGTQIVTDPFSTSEFLELAQMYNITLDQLLSIMAVVLGVVLVAGLLVILGLLIVLRSITHNRVETPVRIKGGAWGLLAGIPGLSLIAVVYVSLGLTLLNNDLGRQILVFMGIR